MKIYSICCILPGNNINRCIADDVNVRDDTININIEIAQKSLLKFKTIACVCGVCGLLDGQTTGYTRLLHTVAG